MAGLKCWLRRRAVTYTKADSRLTLPLEILLAALESSFTKIGRSASASADFFAAARLRLLVSGPPPSTPPEGITDVIVLSDERTHER